jgi:dimethylglycine dehydrogenase
MNQQARVVVIGGGIVGCSVLYHLVKLGWSDVALMERRDLTHGATWHAAGNTHTHNTVLTVCKLQAYSLELYARLEAETGQNVGMHTVGGLFLASAPERLDEFRYFESKYRALGLDYRMVEVDEIRERHPLVSTEGLLGALYDPEEGYVDPYSVTQALATGARQGGARIVRNNTVIGLTPMADGGWTVHTEQGDWRAEFIVNAAGYWAKDIARMTGGDLPLVCMEHHYVVTDRLADIEALNRELPMIRDVDAGFYMRQEGNGLLAGAWEQQATPWALDGVPKDFGQDLLPVAMERIEDNLLRIMERVPAFGEAGIKRTVNGAVCFCADTRPVLGPMPGQRNHFVAAGFLGGITQGGGFGKALAEWLVDGEPELDTFAIDVARFGDFATDDWALAKVKDVYPRRYAITYPMEERRAGRPARTTPLYEVLGREENAVFGTAFGWERPLWYAREGEAAEDHLSFRRSNWFDPVSEECAAVHNAVGLVDMSAFAKFEISGRDSEAFLDRVLANALPKTGGRVVLTPMLTPRGGIIGDFTVTRLEHGGYYLVGASAGEGYFHRWFESRRRPDEELTIRAVTSEKGALGVVGPKAREVLQSLSEADVGSESLPFMGALDARIGPAPARVLRVSYVGELGFELHHPAECQPALYRALRKVGSVHGMRMVGARAVDALRLEKGYRSWRRELSPEYGPDEVGVGRFVAVDKGEFIGRDAVLAARDKGFTHRIATLAVEAEDADALGSEAVFHNGDLVGYVTSGGYGRRVGTSLAAAYLPAELAEPGVEFDIEILGARRPARAVSDPLYDPTNRRMRA